MSQSYDNRKLTKFLTQLYEDKFRHKTLTILVRFSDNDPHDHIPVFIIYDRLVSLALHPVKRPQGRSDFSLYSP